MSNHEKLINEADELYDALDEEARNRISFGWSYVGNRELGDVLKRLFRVEAVIYGVIVVGILSLIIAKILGS